MYPAWRGRRSNSSTTLHTVGVSYLRSNSRSAAETVGMKEILGGQEGFALLLFGRLARLAPASFQFLIERRLPARGVGVGADDQLIAGDNLEVIRRFDVGSVPIRGDQQFAALDTKLRHVRRCLG